MLVPTLVAACLCLVVALVSQRSKLRDARASVDALKTVGGRERDRLSVDVSEARGECDHLRRELADAQSALATLNPAPSLVGRTLVVHTRDDQTIRGVVHGQYADRLTLRDAILVTPVGDQAVGGLQHIPESNLAWSEEPESKHLKPAPVARLDRARGAS